MNMAGLKVKSRNIGSFLFGSTGCLTAGPFFRARFVLSQPDVDFFEENQQLLALKLPRVDGRDSTGWFAICRFPTHICTL